MKKAIAIIISLIILLIVATYFVGGVAEKRFRQIIATLNEVPGVSAKVDTYSKSLFYAIAHSTIVANGITYGFDSVIHHGPIVFQDLNKYKKGFSSPIKFKTASVTNKLVSMTASSASSAPLENTVESTAEKSILPNVPIVWEMNFPYSGDIEINSQGSPFEIIQDQLYLKFSGWDSTGQFSESGKSFAVDTTVEELGVGKAPEKNIFVILRNVKGVNDYKESKEVKTNQTLLTIEKIQVPMLSGTEANFLKIRFDLAKQLTTMEILLGFSLDMLNLGANQPSIGPERLQIRITNLDLEAMQTFISKKSNELTSEQNKALMLKILQRTPKISLEKIEINLPENPQMQIPKGQIIIDGYLTIGGPGITDFNNAEQMLKSINAEITGSVTKEILRSFLESNKKNEMMPSQAMNPHNPQMNMTVEQMDADVKLAVDQIIAELIAENIITENGPNYDFNFKIVDGHWVNKDRGTPVKILEDTFPLSKQPMTQTKPTSAVPAPAAPITPPATAPTSPTSPPSLPTPAPAAPAPATSPVAEPSTY